MNTSEPATHDRLLSLRSTDAALAACIVLGACLAASKVVEAAQEWKPEKPVIFVKLLQERRLVPVPVAVVTRPGGGGAVAYNYINQRPGDGHYLALGSWAILTNHVAGHGPSHTELTPVATLFDEYISVTVKPISHIRTGTQLVDFMKRDPAAMTFGIATSLGNPNHQGVAAAFKTAGLDLKKMKSVIFASGGAATTAMLGGHIDVVPNEIDLNFWESAYKGSVETRRHMARDNEGVKIFLTELGLAGKKRPVLDAHSDSRVSEFMYLEPDSVICPRAGVRHVSAQSKKPS